MAGVVIYGLVDPRTGEIRYVGKTVEPAKRLYMHVYIAVTGRRDSHKDRWIRELARLGLRPEMVTLATCESSEWQRVERETIATLKANGRLTNLTGGGEGVDMPRTPEWCERIGRAHRGKVISDEVRQRLRDVNLAKHPTCRQGHAWTTENTAIVLKRGREYRSCRTCQRQRGAQQRRKKGVPTLEQWRAMGSPLKGPRKPRPPATHCKRGHPLAGWNLLDRGSGRECRTCTNERQARRKRERRKESSDAS